VIRRAREKAGGEGGVIESDVDDDRMSGGRKRRPPSPCFSLSLVNVADRGAYTTSTTYACPRHLGRAQRLVVFFASHARYQRPRCKLPAPCPPARSCHRFEFVTWTPSHPRPPRPLVPWRPERSISPQKWLATADRYRTQTLSTRVAYQTLFQLGRIEKGRTSWWRPSGATGRLPKRQLPYGCSPRRSWLCML
jgi:hypothetical protein